MSIRFIPDPGGGAATRSVLELVDLTDVTAKTGTGTTVVMNEAPTFTGASAVKFQSSAQWADNKTASFGTGDDLQLRHDGTDNLIISKIPNSATAVGFTKTWESSEDRGAAGALDDDALIEEWNWTDASDVSQWSMRLYPSKNIVSGVRSNALVLNYAAAANVAQLGLTNNTGGGFSGFSQEGSTLRLYNTGVNVLSFSTAAGGLRDVQLIDGLIDTTLMIRGRQTSYDPGDILVRTSSFNNYSPAVGLKIHEFAWQSASGVYTPRFQVWDDDGAGLPQDNKLSFDDDDPGVARDTYLVYDSTGSTLDCFVDGTEVWNADGNRLSAKGLGHYSLTVIGFHTVTPT